MINYNIIHLTEPSLQYLLTCVFCRSKCLSGGLYKQFTPVESWSKQGIYWETYWISILEVISLIEIFALFRNKYLSIILITEFMTLKLVKYVSDLIAICWAVNQRKVSFPTNINLLITIFGSVYFYRFTQKWNDNGYEMARKNKISKKPTSNVQ